MSEQSTAILQSMGSILHTSEHPLLWDHADGLDEFFGSHARDLGSFPRSVICCTVFWDQLVHQLGRGVVAAKQTFNMEPTDKALRVQPPRLTPAPRSERHLLGGLNSPIHEPLTTSPCRSVNYSP